MLKDNFISIVLPVFNGEVYLGEAIESILNQTYTNFELIIVNDCSSDQSNLIAEKFQKRDNRIKIIHNSINKKLPASLNIGHRAAKGDYLTWTSHDNLLKPDFLEVLENEALKQNAPVVYSNFDIIDDKGKIIREHNAEPANQLLFGNTVGTSFLYKREVYDTLKGYNESLFLVEDYDFWLRAAILFPFAKVNENIYAYRLQEHSLTTAIQQDGQIKKEHAAALFAMFSSIAKELNWDTSTLDFVLSKHLNKPYALKTYFINRISIKRDVLVFTKLQQQSSFKHSGVYFYLRSLLKKNRKEQTLSNVLKIFIREKNILFHKTYSTKETIKLIAKCLF
jgi:glycosyltransferase involved in cell wall biosynthesis